MRDFGRRPDFADPPLSEVALSVQFDDLPDLRGAPIFVLWTEELRDRYPRVEEHPPLPPAYERFGVAKPPQVRLQTLAGFPTPRYWFVDRAGKELVQVQQDRFAFNWRRVGRASYPRYERVRAQFRKELDVFLNFVAREGLGEVRANQCEVTYVNEIGPSGVWRDHGEAGKIFSFWSQRSANSFPGRMESLRASAPWIIEGEGGEPVGRLHMTLESAFSVETSEPIFVFTLTARGAPLGEGKSGITAFLNLGREWVVWSFAALTTKAMHETWRRIDDR